ncbi:UNVERIFIED_CONTAM: hypothetical protein K2H54_034069 [Gekko kuhli]
MVRLLKNGHHTISMKLPPHHLNEDESQGIKFNFKSMGSQRGHLVGVAVFGQKGRGSNIREKLQRSRYNLDMLECLALSPCVTPDILGPQDSQKNDICLAFTEKLLKDTTMDYYSTLMQDELGKFDVVMESKANAIVLYGDTNTVSYIRWSIRMSEFTTAKLKGKVYIMTIQMDFVSYYYQRNWDTQLLHGAISFTVHTNQPPGFQEFLQSRKPHMSEGDGFIRDFWEQAFLCHFSDSLLELGFGKNCTGEEKLESLPADIFDMSMTGPSYNIYNAVYAVAHALHALHSSCNGHRRMVERNKCNFFSQPSWQVTLLGRKKTMNLGTRKGYNLYTIRCLQKLFVNSSSSLLC